MKRAGHKMVAFIAVIFISIGLLGSGGCAGPAAAIFQVVSMALTGAQVVGLATKLSDSDQPLVLLNGLWEGVDPAKTVFLFDNRSNEYQMGESGRIHLRGTVAVLKESGALLILKVFNDVHRRPGKLSINFLDKNTFKATFVANNVKLFDDLTFHRVKPGKKKVKKTAVKDKKDPKAAAKAKGDKKPASLVPPAAKPGKPGISSESITGSGNVGGPYPSTSSPNQVPPKAATSTTSPPTSSPTSPPTSPPTPPPGSVAPSAPATGSAGKTTPPPGSVAPAK